MKFLNSQQLAFLLDIKKEDARAKMCVAWCKEHGIDNEAEWSKKKKVEDKYPLAMPVELLSKHLSLPDLQYLVDDVVNNYLVRPVSRKYILCDLPEKIIKKAEEQEEHPQPKFAIPPALRSMLPTETQKIIWQEWEKRFPKYFKKKECLITNTTENT